MNQCNKKSIMFLVYLIYIHIKKLLFFLFNLKSTTLTIKTKSSKSKVIKRKSVITNTSSISSSSSSSSSTSSSSVETNIETDDTKALSPTKRKTDNISINNKTNTKELNNNNNNISTNTNVNNNSDKSVTIKNKDTKVNDSQIEQTSSKDKSKRSKLEIDSQNTTDSETKQLCRIKRSPSVARRRRKEKKVLVLDLDETLIHSTSRGSRNHDYMIEVLLDKHICLYYVYKRPYVDSFLKKVSEWYKVVVFTASLKEYADPVIDYLDPEKKIFSKRYFRESCQFRNGIYMKDLQIIEKDLSKICLVDNSSFSYEINKENGIPIETWINDPKDRELLNLLPFLDALRFVEDVRSILSLRL